jgi:dimethylargininase
MYSRTSTARRRQITRQKYAWWACVVSWSPLADLRYHAPMWTAITREVSASLAQCQLTHLPRVPLDVHRARIQHAEYEGALRQLGVRIVRAPPVPNLPDAVFVEDIAVVVDEAAVITRPGAASRRPEIPGIADALAPYRRLLYINSPASLDGGDVLRIGNTFYVGLSQRTNPEGAAQLHRLLAPWNYQVQALEVRGCLHLKSAVTPVADGLLLVNPAWLPPDAFSGLDRIEVDPAEPYAANALRIGDAVIYPAHFPRTRARLKARGIRVLPIPCDELAKAEGAVTCCSILFHTTS